MRAALVAVQHATEQWVSIGIFQHGVLTRLKLWISGLPDDREQLAAAIAEMAEKVGRILVLSLTVSALDERGMPVWSRWFSTTLSWNHAFSHPL